MRLEVLALAVVVVSLSTIVNAAVPTAEDVAACNQSAKEAVKKSSASPGAATPNTQDRSRAAEARRGETDSRGGATRSPDPQLEGMSAEGAKDPVYQAAYRTCMRKAGF